MNRTLAVLAVMGFAGTIGVSAQMKHVDLKDAKGNNAGMVMISPAKGGGVSIDIEVKGLTAGEHAIHFHAVPKCEAPFKSAGAHFNPANKKHGQQNPEGPHAGDMANCGLAAITPKKNGSKQRLRALWLPPSFAMSPWGKEGGGDPDGENIRASLSTHSPKAASVGGKVPAVQ